jgi:hypothetical protein
LLGGASTKIIRRGISFLGQAFKLVAKKIDVSGEGLAHEVSGALGVAISVISMRGAVGRGKNCGDSEAPRHFVKIVGQALVIPDKVS